MWADELDEPAALALVRARYPDLAGERIAPIRHGWDTYAFLVDEQWIARVPRRDEAERSLRREAELLVAIAPRLPSPVPHVERVSEESPAVVVTRRIAGSPATGEAKTGAELGRFLAALHAVPVESVPLPRASVADWRAEHDRRRGQFEEHVFQFLGAGERRKARSLFASVEFDFEPIPVHGDVAISLGQLLPRAETLVVTTPQPAAQEVAARAGAMAQKTGMRLTGVVENMSGDVFGSGGGQSLADELGIPLLGTVQLDPLLRECGDAGAPLMVTAPESATALELRRIADAVLALDRGTIVKPLTLISN